MFDLAAPNEVEDDCDLSGYTFQGLVQTIPSFPSQQWHNLFQLLYVGGKSRNDSLQTSDNRILEDDNKVNLPNTITTAIQYKRTGSALCYFSLGQNSNEIKGKINILINIALSSTIFENPSLYFY